MGRIRNAYNVSAGDSEAKKPLVRQGIILKGVFLKHIVDVQNGFIRIGTRSCGELL
jgi:hypothetical protein